MGFGKITLQQIGYFNAVVKHLNFTEAAKSLYVSQPSLSKQIAMLESEMCVQLFYRTKRDVRLTTAGLVLYRELGGISDVIQKAIDKTKKAGFAQSGSITIGVLEAMETQMFLPKVIEEFIHKYSDVNVIIERYSFKKLREKLISGAIDVMFSLSFELDDSLGVISNTVYRANAYILMGKSHPLAIRDQLGVSDLKKEKFVIISRDESPRGFDAIVGLCHKHGFTPNIVKELPNIGSILSCVEVGIGVSLVDCNIRLYGKDQFKCYKIEEETIDVVMAWRKENLNPVIPVFTHDVVSPYL